MLTLLHCWSKERWICFSIIFILSFTSLMMLRVLQYDYQKRTQEAQILDIPTQHADLQRAIGSFNVIDGLIKPVMKKYNASRVYVLRIHYGPIDVSKTTTYSVSVANVVAQPGTEISSSDITDVPASIFSIVLIHLVNDQSFRVKTSDLPNGGLREILENRHAVMSAWYPIFDKTGMLVGMLAADWDKDYTLPKNNEQSMINDMSKISRIIGGFFGLPPLNDIPSRNNEHFVGVGQSAEANGHK